MSIPIIATMHTSTITMKSSSFTHSASRSPHPLSASHSPLSSSTTKAPLTAHLAARSAITLYPPGSDPIPTTTTTTQPTTKSGHGTPTPDSFFTSSPTIPATAFWAVLSALIFVLLALALAFPTWYFLRNRHKYKSISSSSPISWPSSSHSIPWSPHPQQFSPTQMQQLQILNQLQSPPPVANPSDPNRRALLARLAALNNPSILGAIPEDSTVLTSSSVYPGNERQLVNTHWANVKEKRLQEAKDRGEVCEKEAEAAAGEEWGKKEKKVRFREREWAVLASDGGGSRLEDVQWEDEGNRKL
ncbi:MAG: hypothetical protein Q9213_000643 [Squamulea squamosa]